MILVKDNVCSTQGLVTEGMESERLAVTTNNWTSSWAKMVSKSVKLLTWRNLKNTALPNEAEWMYNGISLFNYNPDTWCSSSIRICPSYYSVSHIHLRKLSFLHILLKRSCFLCIYFVLFLVPYVPRHFLSIRDSVLNNEWNRKRTWVYRIYIPIEGTQNKIKS